MAKVVGRWQDGTPLSLSPNGPDPAIAGDPNQVNNFRYADDPDGARCPLGAHIRRTNPRDNDGMFGGKLSNRHKIIRRGRPYGPPLPEGITEDDKEERGLVFRCFQASIARQFETIQSLWVDDGDGLHTGADKDYLIGDGTGSNKMTVQGSPPFVLTPQPVFTVVKGGEYLIRPSLRALRWLAAGKWSELAARVAEYGPVAFVVTVGEEGRPHVVAVPVGWDGDSLVTSVGHTTGANAAARPDVTVLWSALPESGYSLIVDGRAAPGTAGGDLRITPTRAVLHRTPAADPSAPNCITILARPKP